MTFTHDTVNDTTIERDGDEIVFTFVNDGFTYDTDTFRFKMSQNMLFSMIVDYFELGRNADIFDDLTLPQQDALFDALLFMDRKNIEL